MYISTVPENCLHQKNEQPHSNSTHSLNDDRFSSGQPSTTLVSYQSKNLTNLRILPSEVVKKRTFHHFQWRFQNLWKEGALLACTKRVHKFWPCPQIASNHVSDHSLNRPLNVFRKWELASFYEVGLVCCHYQFLLAHLPCLERGTSPYPGSIFAYKVSEKGGGGAHGPCAPAWIHLWFHVYRSNWEISTVHNLASSNQQSLFIICLVEPLYCGHLWDSRKWPD